MAKVQADSLFVVSACLYDVYENQQSNDFKCVYSVKHTQLAHVQTAKNSCDEFRCEEQK